MLSCLHVSKQLLHCSTSVNIQGIRALGSEKENYIINLCDGNDLPLKDIWAVNQSKAGLTPQHFFFGHVQQGRSPRIELGYGREIWSPGTAGLGMSWYPTRKAGGIWEEGGLSISAYRLLPL